MNAQELYLQDGKSTGIYFCEKCRRVSKDKEHSDTCCVPYKCETCGKETPQYWTVCDSCRSKKRAETFLAAEAVDWDGVTPICIYDSDEYFFDQESLIDYLLDNDLDTKTILLELCEPQYGSEFCIADHLTDVLPPEYDYCVNHEGKVLEKAINDWIQKQGAFSWISTGKRINPESLADIQEELDERNNEEESGK